MGDSVREILQSGPLIVLALAVLIGVVVHRLWRRFWAASAAATLLGSLLWVGGCYLRSSSPRPANSDGRRLCRSF